MYTEFLDEVTRTLYTDFDLPYIPVGTLVSTRFFTARRVIDSHYYINGYDEVDQVLVVSKGGKGNAKRPSRRRR